MFTEIVQRIEISELKYIQLWMFMSSNIKWYCRSNHLGKFEASFLPLFSIPCCSLTKGTVDGVDLNDVIRIGYSLTR